MISPEAIKEFREIWKEEFNEDLPEKIVVEEATNLLTIFNVIYRPIKKEWFDKYEDEDEK